MMDIQHNSDTPKNVTLITDIDNRQILKAFNDHFIEFFEDVERVFPENKDVTSAKRAVMSFRKMNPRLLIMVFHNSIGKIYREHINNGNLNFFIEKDYSQEVQTSKNGDMLIQKINALREPINNMSGSDKKKVMTYLNNLVYLSDIFHNNI